MRIAYNSQIFLDQRHGGVSRYFAKLCEELLLMGEQPRVFTLFHRNEYLRDLPPEVARGKPIGDKFERVARKINQLLEVPGMTFWKPDVVHETFYETRKSSPSRVPVIVTIHDMIHEVFASDFSPGDPVARRKQEALGRADKVICVSENTKNDLVRISGIPLEKISVVHHGCDPYSGAIHSFTGAKHQPRPFILFVGQREQRYKNFLPLLEAYASCAALRDEFDLIAFGGGPFRPSELAFIHGTGLPENRIRQISGDDFLLRSLYREARLFVYPSLYEGFGLPPLEAMGQGCPVASSNTSSMPEVLGDAAHYFDPADPGSMQKAIEQVAFDDSLRPELMEKGKQQLGRFSWRKCAEQTLGVYREVSR